MNAFVARRPRVIFALLVLPILATGALSWTLHRDASALCATAAELRAERARLRAHVAALDQRHEITNRELARALEEKAATASPLTPDARDWPGLLAAITARRDTPGAEGTADGSAAASGMRRPTEPSGPHGNVYFPELFSDPRYAQLYLTEVRSRHAERFAPLFAELSADLRPEELERFKEILAQKEMAYEEVDGIMETEAMREKRPTDRSAAMRVKSQVNRTFETEIRQVFGDAAFAKWRAFENETGARQDFLDSFALRLSYAGPRLEEAQATKLAELYRASRMAALRAGADAPSRMTDQFIASAASFLGPEQVAVLREIRAETNARLVPGASFQIRRTTSTPASVPKGG